MKPKIKPLETFNSATGQTTCHTSIGEIHSMFLQTGIILITFMISFVIVLFSNHKLFAIPVALDEAALFLVIFADSREASEYVVYMWQYFLINGAYRCKRKLSGKKEMVPSKTELSRVAWDETKKLFESRWN